MLQVLWPIGRLPVPEPEARTQMLLFPLPLTFPPFLPPSFLLSFLPPILPPSPFPLSLLPPIPPPSFFISPFLPFSLLPSLFLPSLPPFLPPLPHPASFFYILIKQASTVCACVLSALCTRHHAQCECIFLRIPHNNTARMIIPVGQSGLRRHTERG